MERLKISELLSRGKRPRMTRGELSELVFGADKGRPREGRRHMLSVSRKRNLISDWDGGKSLTALKPRHVLRLAGALGVTRIADLFEG
jgi:hypothetical protein